MNKLYVYISVNYAHDNCEVMSALVHVFTIKPIIHRFISMDIDV